MEVICQNIVGNKDHWCWYYTNWPKSDYDVCYRKPTYGELDEECKTKEKSGNCRYL